MKYKFIFFILCLFLFAYSSYSVYSVELPEIILGNGINSIALSVVNTYNDNITNLALDYNEDKLPSWLTVSTVVQDINVSKGMKSQEKLLLVMNVIDASDDESYELPFVLRDSHGNQWDYILPVHVRSNIAAFDVLHENYPNPFNPSTTIKYGLKEDRHTSLVIYNSLGQKVRTLIDQPQTAGIHAVRWDGKNDAGLQVSSGLYIYRLVSGQFSQTRRMILLD